MLIMGEMGTVSWNSLYYLHNFLKSKLFLKVKFILKTKLTIIKITNMFGITHCSCIVLSLNFKFHYSMLF